MKKIVVALVACASLSGCLSWVKGPVEECPVRVEYVARKAPKEMYAIPPYPERGDVFRFTQSDVARWILKAEERTQVLERQLRALEEFYDRPVQPDEKTKGTM